MADFDPAVALVLENEGGYTNDPEDPGGETNFGISRRYHPEVDIRNLTRDQAIAIYLADYWTPHHFDLLPRQSIANKVFDEAINIGPVASIRILQLSLGYFLAGPIIADGKIGLQTAAYCAEVADDKLLPELRARYTLHHANDVYNNPNLRADLLGLFRRDVQ